VARGVHVQSSDTIVLAAAVWNCSQLSLCNQAFKGGVSSSKQRTRASAQQRAKQRHQRCDSEGIRCSSYRTD
jgi:hypothetical protein